jgi:N-acetylglucosamine kinase-like BadF-type ATPase
MILIAESGSTKCDWWLLVDGVVNKQFHTQGFNPFFHSVEEIIEGIEKNSGLVEIRQSIQVIKYLGAGCSSEQKKAVVKKALVHVFKNADISVDHDLMGAAYATYDGSPGITGILGTGSNACYFDGQELTQKSPSLGFIMGDEGGGGYFGKKLIIAYAYGWLSDEVAIDFRNTFNTSVNELIHRVNSVPHANVFLAGFMPFILKHKADVRIHKMLLDGMNEYFINHILPFPESQKAPLHFVGSVAYYFKDVIEEVALKHNVVIGDVIQKPGSRVVDYFVKYVL